MVPPFHHLHRSAPLAADDVVWVVPVHQTLPTLLGVCSSERFPASTRSAIVDAHTPQGSSKTLGGPCLRMRAHTGTLQLGLLLSIAAGVVTGAALTAFATIHGFASYSAVPELLLDFWHWWLVEGALAGGIVGAFCWILWRPQDRFTRGILAVLGIHWADLAASPTPR